MPLAASLAAQLRKEFPNADVSYAPGPKKSEYAVIVDGKLIFSRLERYCCPDTDEIIDYCKKYLKSKKQ